MNSKRDDFHPTQQAVLVAAVSCVLRVCKLKSVSSCELVWIRLNLKCFERAQNVNEGASGSAALRSDQASQFSFQS